MKKIILVLAVTLVVFSCSKDTINTEIESTADLTQMTPSKSLDQSSEGMYFGVFGHNTVKELHGKITINTGNNEKYSALIQMVNGETIKFEGTSINNTNIHFTSNRGSFDFNTIDFRAPKATNVFIDKVSESYIVSKKQTTRGIIPMVLLGTYAETGNEANFSGNWDMLGDGVDFDLFGQNAQVVSTVIISHIGGAVITDTTMEPQPGLCTGIPDTYLWDANGDVFTGANPSAFAHFQTTPIAGFDASWGMEYRRDLGEQQYVDEDCLFIVASGFWSWFGKTGTILASEPGPSPLTNSIDTRDTASLKLQ